MFYSYQRRKREGNCDPASQTACPERKKITWGNSGSTGRESTGKQRGYWCFTPASMEELSNDTVTRVLFHFWVLMTLLSFAHVRWHDCVKKNSSKHKQKVRLNEQLMTVILYWSLSLYRKSFHVKSDANDVKYLPTRTQWSWIYRKYDTPSQNNNVQGRVDTWRNIC